MVQSTNGTTSRSRTSRSFQNGAFSRMISILTIALADTIITGTPYAENLKKFYQLYPGGGYGGSFHSWAQSNSSAPYNSWGNGAAMRISPVGFAFDDLETVLQKAVEFTAITHDNPEGIKGGQATAAAIFLGRTGQSKAEIKTFIETRFGYDLSRHVDEIRPSYTFDVSCQGTVPQAIRAFLDSTDFEDAIRTAISLGGDSDTLACITGGIAQAFYGGVPDEIQNKVYTILDEKLGGITRIFMKTYCAFDEKAMNPFFEILTEAVQNNWCIDPDCTTCGAQDFRRALHSPTALRNQSLTDVLKSLEINELRNFRCWEGTVRIALNEIRNASDMDQILQAWIPQLSENIRLADIVLFHFIRRGALFTPVSIEVWQKWVDNCISLAFATKDESLLESLVYTLGSSIKNNLELWELIVQASKNSRSLQRALEQKQITDFQ